MVKPHRSEQHGNSWRGRVLQVPLLSGISLSFYLCLLLSGEDGNEGNTAARLNKPYNFDALWHRCGNTNHTKTNKEMRAIIRSIKAILTGAAPLLCHRETSGGISFHVHCPCPVRRGGVWVDMALENRESGKLNLNKTVNSSVKQALKMMSQKHKINVSQRYNKSNI